MCMVMTEMRRNYLHAVMVTMIIYEIYIIHSCSKRKTIIHKCVRVSHVSSLGHAPRWLIGYS